MHQHSFFALTGHEWNQLPDDAKQLSYRDFKKYITQQLSTPSPPLYYSHGTKALNILHTRLRTDMSQLNANAFKIQKSDTPACSCGHPQENTAHFILSCPKYTSHRNTLFHNLSHTLNCNFLQKPRHSQLQILLHGAGLSGSGGREVARHFQNYIQSSLRFT